MPSELFHVVGYLSGVALYAMLLAMAIRDKEGDRLTVGTGVLGLGWNVGQLLVFTSRSAGWWTAEPWLAAGSFCALSLLAAIVVHSVSRDPSGAVRHAQVLPIVAYSAAGISGLMQLRAAAVSAQVPDSRAFLLLTTCLLALAPALVILTRRQANGRRATWMTGLAVFAVSALHLGNFHGAQESWSIEILGHHASIPLAFAILYQDYRFALADLFLKRALTLLVLVAVIFGSWSAVGPFLIANPDDPRAIGLLLLLWMSSTLVYPAVRNAIGRFVDRVVLVRVNYATLVDDVSALIQRCDAEDEVLDRACAVLAPALSASTIDWEPRHLSAPSTPDATDVKVFTTDAPQYVMVVRRLSGGRRLLSDDVAMLERVAAVVGRRIDALRLSDERYERVLREQEMHALATEAELRALRAQINPHFLFNSLTTIGYLIQTAPSRALDTLLRLTTLFRSVLRSDGELTTVGRERELLECYLQIEQQRFEERLTVELDIPEELHDEVLPALVIQPLVENAIKHGIAHARLGGRITVIVRMHPHPRELRVKVLNTGVPFAGRSPASDGGVGLRNVERRLVGYYGPTATLTLSGTASGETVAELRLPVGRLDALEPVGTIGERRRR